MTSNTIRLLPLLIVLSVACRAAHAEPVDLRVRIAAPTAPSEVNAQNEIDLQRNILARAADATYLVSLPRPEPGALALQDKLDVPYRLVGVWADGREQIYLGLHSRLPATVDVVLFRNPISFDTPGLNKIDALGSDIDSQLEKYSAARTFHIHWRTVNGLPNHTIAIRSAKLWFDAAASLAMVRNGPFRMDEDVQKIMTGYEELAKRDAKFRERYREVVRREGYVVGTNAQVRASRYAFVGDIPDLVQSGEVEDAAALNAKALKALSKETLAVRRVVAAEQGVDIHMLKLNRDFLGSIQR